MGAPRFVGPAGQAIRDPGPKATALLAFLATCAGNRATRSELVELIWSDARSSSAARHALRQCLVRLRSHLGAAGDALAADAEAVWLVSGAVESDLDALVAALRGGGETAILEASARVRGSFCAGLDVPAPEFETWLRDKRAELDLACAELHRRAARVLAGRSEPDAAIAAARRRVALDPLDEEAQAELIELCLRVGRAGAAREAYDRCAARFREDLGIEPGPRVVAALGRRFPPMRRAPRRPAPAPRATRTIGTWIGRAAVALAIASLSAQVLDWARSRPASVGDGERPMALWVTPATAEAATPLALVRREGGDRREEAKEYGRNAAYHPPEATLREPRLYPAGC
ncbi:AfsR/SARP family transcriptional regulator [Amaricoccus solimangrovi]|nr:BTAD domain-containing putative transcriptional regulator [Amaricoccus solimangrovi]